MISIRIYKDILRGKIVVNFSPAGYRTLKALWILGADKNSKKLQLEASLGVVHKRNSSIILSYVQFENLPLVTQKETVNYICL